MGLINFVRNGVQEMMVARPDNMKHLIVYKHPDGNIPTYSRLTVDMDECAVFFKSGAPPAVGALPPGRYPLSTENIPFLNNFVTSFTGGNIFQAEVFFVKNQPVRNLTFGGQMMSMRDPELDLRVTPRAYGTYAMVVTDPTRFIIGYTGQAAQGDNDQITSWLRQRMFQGLSKTIGGDFTDFTVDNLGNIYVLSKENQLKKLSPNGDSLAIFNDVRRFGKVFSIDVTNPLKIVVYYREFTMVIELDRFLNIVNTIDLRKLNILQAKAVGLAYDNNVWVYDELDAKLKRIGDDGSLVDQTTDFRQLFDSTPDPSVLRDQGGYVYLYDTIKGVYIFDHYGALKTHIVLPGWKDFDVLDKSMLGRDAHSFFRYQQGSLDIQEEPIPAYALDARLIRIMPSAIYVLKKTGLEVYSNR